MTCVQNRSWLKAQLEILPPPATVLHLGAGTGSDFDIFCGVGADRIILVEPDPEALAELLTKTRNVSYAKVLPLAVGSHNGTATLHRFNFPQRNSLCKPTELNRLLPGLVEARSTEVVVRTATDLVRELELSDARANWLIVETPGISGTILRELADSGLLHRFSSIVLRAADEPLYEGACGLKEMLQILHPRGYRQRGAEDRSDPTWPRLHLELSADAVECTQLKQGLEKGRQERDRLEQELRSTLSSFEQQRQTLEQKLKSRASELEQARQERKRLEQNLVKRESELDDWRQSNSRSVEELKSRLESLQSDLSVSIRLQKLREADLEDLQRRYAAILDLKGRQEELLLRLRQKLQVASDHLKQIDAQTDESARRDLASRLVKALAGEIGGN